MPGDNNLFNKAKQRPIWSYVSNCYLENDHIRNINIAVYLNRLNPCTFWAFVKVKRPGDWYGNRVV